jgi:hypothetical protein
MLANADRGLYLVSPDGTATPFAQGPGGYTGPAGVEAYIDVSPGLHVAAANCDFAPDDVFILRPGGAIGLTRVDAAGRAANFVRISGVDSLNGIAFDRTGRFDHRLLLTGPHQGKTVVLAIDCKGAIQRITASAPTVEGGIAVAPASFGAFAGDLIAPDELSGSVWAIDPAGKVALVTATAIRHGQDVGVESEGFVPTGFTAGGFAYVADRATSGSPHPGTDTILRLSADQLQAAGVRDGDLLIAAEGGAVTVDIRCQAACQATTVVTDETSAHGEGHLLVIATAPSATSTPTATPTPKAAPSPTRATRTAAGTPWLLPLIAAIVLAALVAMGVVLVRRRH